MENKKVITVDIQTNATEAEGSITNFKAALKEANAELLQMRQNFGDTSQEAVDAAKKVAGLKDAIGDAKDMANAFKPGGGFQAVAQAGQVAASGFAAAQGAMALFGAESENVQAALLKVQSAMALAEGLGALADAGDAFKNLKTVAVNAFNSIKAAITSTGIGALIVGLGLLIAYWDDISDAVSGATDETRAYDLAQKSVNTTVAKTQENLMSVKIALDQAKKGVISKEEALKTYNDKLGTTLGKTDDLAVAEQRIKDNTAGYIKAQIARAQAQVFVAKSAEAAAKAATGEDADLSWWQKAEVALVSYGNSAAGAQVSAQLSVNNMKENQKEVVYYNGLAVKAANEAAEEEGKINATTINKKYDANKKSLEEGAKAGEQEKKQHQSDLEALAALTQKYSNDTQQLKAKTDEEKLAEEKRVAQQELDGMAGSKKEKAAAQAALDAEFKQKEIDLETKKNDEFKALKLKYEQDLQDLEDVTQAAKLARAEQRAIDEINQGSLTEERKLEAIRLVKEKYKVLNEENDKAVADAKLVKDQEDMQVQLDGTALSIQERYALVTQNEEALTANKEISEEARTAAEDKNTAARIQIGKLEKDAKAQQLAGIGNALQNMAAIAGESTTAGKAFAIASTAISTYSTAQKAYESAFLPVPTVASPALGAVFAGVAVAGGLMNIQKILSVKTPSGGGGGGGGSVPSASAPPAPPSFNVVGNSGANQLAQTITETNKNAAPVQAYVVSGDVSSAQSLDRNRVSNASMG